MPAGQTLLRLVVRPDVTERSSADEVIELAPEMVTPVALRGAAVVAWRLLAQPTSMHELAERVVSDLAPDAEAALALAEVADAVRTLRDRGLVVVAE